MKKLFERYGIGKEAWAFLFLPIYILGYILAERLIPAEICWASWCPLDDAIPFLKGFVFAYITWYPLVVFTAAYLLFKETKQLLRLAAIVIPGLTICVILFFIIPSRQDLRPVVEGSDLASLIIRGIYRVDTNTNVFPSMHVVGTLGAVVGIVRAKSIRLPAKILLLTDSVLVIASTVFIKQHSILDIFSGIALFAILYIILLVFESRREKKAVKAEAVCTAN